MTISRALLASLLISLFLFQLIHAQPTVTKSNGVGGNPPKKIDCGSACEVRCSLTKRPKLCKRACGTCCARCNCVPPGTAGNEDVCPCYATMTTHNGRHKCP